MKKIFFLFILFAISVSLFSCKKDSGSSKQSYYIKANIDGSEKTYSSNAMATELNSSGVYAISLVAASSSTSSEGMNLQITKNGSAIVAGTYTDATSSSEYAVGGVYNPGTSDVSGIFGAGIQLSTDHPLQIVVSNISSSAISGTFSGEFFDNSGAGSNSILITNGEFNLPVK